jgi:hypothetical protein
MYDESELRDGLRVAVVQSERESAVIDVGRAMRSGARRRVLARTGQVAGLTALIGVLLAAGWAVLPSGPDVSRMGEPPPTPLALEVLDGIDPRVRYLDLRSLAGDYPDQYYEVGTTTERYGTARVVGLTPAGRRVEVDLYPVGITPQLPLRDSAETRLLSSEPTTLLDGRPASWLTFSEPEVPEAVLRWRHPAGGWIQLRVVDERGGDLRAEARRVAGALRTPGDLLELPFDVVDRPANLVLTYVAVTDHSRDGGTISSASFVPADQVSDGDNLVHVAVVPSGNAVPLFPDGPPAPNTTVDGHQAYRRDDDGTDALFVYDVSGWTVTAVQGRAAGEPFGPGGADTVYRHIVVRGVDRATWTTMSP